MALLRTLAAVVALCHLADAIPTISFPLNSQVPPVARVSEPFSYTFSNSTFSSALQISYSLSSAPSWLSLDSTTRTLSGTPSVNDVGTDAVTGLTIGLTATDQSGSVTLTATLVVSKNPAPVVSVPASAQLPSFGEFSTPSTLLLHPSTPFKFNFESGTFSGNGGGSGLQYYAVTAENTPLPSWVTFDSSALSFSGQTPDYLSLIQPPQTFGFQLVASDVEGFSGTSIFFDIEVGIHLLAFSKDDMVVSATPGVNINFNGLAESLEIDGQVANVSSLASITAQTPPWLEFSNSTLALSGVAPIDATSYNVTVQATDIYGDTANTTVYINVTNIFFTQQIGEINATIGTAFSYDFSSVLGDKSAIELNAQFSPATSWLSLDSQTDILSGQVPRVKPYIIGVTLQATSKSSHISSSQSFNISVVADISQTSSTLGTSSSGRTSTSSGTSATDDSKSPVFSSRKRLSRGVIAAIALPIALLFIALLLCIFCYRHRRQNSKTRPDSPTKSDISVPVEAKADEAETKRPDSVAPPDPLPLDTSGFGDDNSSGTFTHEQKGGTNENMDKSVRRSKTFSVMSGALASDFRESQGSRNRARAYSDNALSKTDRSWRSTQDSAYPTIGSRTNSSQRLTRNYSNYSRKGHARRSGRITSADRLRDSNVSTQPVEGAILNLGQGSVSFTPLDNFSVLSLQSSIQRTPELAYSKINARGVKSARRNSRLVPAVERNRSGIGHGGGESISSLASGNEKRKSIGHGQDWSSGSSGLPCPRLARDSRTWLTVQTAEVQEKNRCSNTSNMTESTDLLYPGEPVRMSIKQVPKSPVPNPSIQPSESSNLSRPVSRRTRGSSPFFGSSSSRKSRKSSRSKKVRTSYADSPTVPEESTMVGSLESTIIHGLREGGEAPRDSFGISYGLAHEGTRQLRSYVQSQLGRSRTRTSTKSNESNDSRFESASASMQSLGRAKHLEDPKGVGSAKIGAKDEYEEYLPDDYSEGSWETHHTYRDSQGNVIEYGLEDSPEVVMAAAQSTLKPNLVPGTVFSKWSPNPLIPDIGESSQMVPVSGPRKGSVDAKANNTGSPVRHGELDYTAYI